MISYPLSATHYCSDLSGIIHFFYRDDLQPSHPPEIIQQNSEGTRKEEKQREKKRIPLAWKTDILRKTSNRR